MTALTSSGYLASSTLSLDVAAALAETKSVDVVLVNASEYPGKMIAQLGRALAHNNEVPLMATFSVMWVSTRPRRRSPLWNIPQNQARLWRYTTWCVRVHDAAQLAEELANASWN